MKTILLLFISLFITMMVQAQVSKTIEVTAGNLKTRLTSDELNTVTNLTLTGTIDARDFKTMRDDMPVLTFLDLSSVSINWYKGNYGPITNQEANYPARTIPTNAFYNSQSGLGKTSLKTIVLPLSVTMIESSAFFRCSGLMFINIPSNVTVIGKNSFQDCFGLQSVFIPSSVSVIRESAFANCSGLFSVDIRNQRYSSSSGVLFNKDETRLIQCPGSISGTYTIPNSVSVIGFAAFSGCQNLTSIIIPESTQTIWGEAFMNCINLSEIKVKSIIPIDLMNIVDVFTGVDLASCRLNIPFGSAELYKDANQWKDFKYISEMPGVIIPNNRVNVVSDKGGSITTVIHSNANWTIYSGQPWLQVSSAVGSGTQPLTLSIEPNTEERQRTAFVVISTEGGDSEILTITQTEAPLVIEGGDLKDLNATYDLTGISRLKLTDTIDARDFAIIKNRMPKLSYLDLSETFIDSITINAWNSGNFDPGYYNVNEIPPGAFINEGGVWVNNNDGWGWHFLYGTDSLKSVLLPLTVTTIGAEAFRNCKGLSSIIIPPNVRTIGEMAFSGCSSLTSITIPSTVTYVGSYAFANCTNLNSVYMNSPTVNNECPNHQYSYKDINEDKCTLYVPFGCREIYNTDYYWVDFVDIVEMSGFKLSANYLNITSQSNATNNLEIESDVTWKISSDQSWLTVNPGSGTGDQKLTFTVETNPDVATRTAIVTVSADGVESQTITVTQEGGPTALAEFAENPIQLKCYPNPFTDEISIEIQNPKQSKISVDIYNLAGERIKNLANQRKDENLDLKWNGTNDSGQRVTLGVYICKVNKQAKRLIYQGQKGKY